MLLLNRERRYTDTEPKTSDGVLSKLKEIIDNNEMSECYALFNAIYAVSLLHADMMNDFDNLTTKLIYDAEFCKKIGTGYFFRNIGFSINNKNDKNINTKMFEKAEKLFLNVADDYGYLTNRINLKTYTALNGEINSINENEFLDEINSLIDYGAQHLHVALNNLALFYILRNEFNDLEKAKIEIEKAKIYSYDDMPRVFSGINAALICVRKNDFEKAYETINQYERLANEAKFIRIKQNFYITKAFIAWLDNRPEVPEIIKIAKKYPERRDNHSTISICEKLLYSSLDNFNQSALKDYILPALEYWYINPLKFIDITYI